TQHPPEIASRTGDLRSRSFSSFAAQWKVRIFPSLPACFRSLERRLNECLQRRQPMSETVDFGFLVTQCLIHAPLLFLYCLHEHGREASIIDAVISLAILGYDFRQGFFDFLRQKAHLPLVAKVALWKLAAFPIEANAAQFQ